MFKPGSKVTIVNQMMSGTYFIEGRARVLSHLDDDRYVVLFEGDTTSGQAVERFVDPRAQAMPAEYVAELNISAAR